MRRLAELRKERNISQEKLAEYFNLTQQSIYKYEHDLAEPDIQTLKGLSRFFHVSVDYLIENTESTSNVEPVLIEKAPLTAREAHLISLYRKLDASTAKHLDYIVEKLVN